MFRVLYLTKLILEFNVKNIDVFFSMSIGIYPYTMIQKSLNILFLDLYKFEKKSNFHYKVWFSENTDFLLKLNFYITKIVQIVCNMC